MGISELKTWTPNHQIYLSNNERWKKQLQPAGNIILETGHTRKLR
jgi:hypothetical protein